MAGLYFLCFYDIIPINEVRMKSTIALALLLIYTVLEIIAYMPQIIKILKTKHADDLSLTSWFMWIASDTSYLGYVLLESPEPGIVFLAVFSLSFVFIVFFLTLFYQNHDNARKTQRIKTKKKHIAHRRLVKRV